MASFHRSRPHTRRRQVLLAAVVAVLAMLALACQPVASYGQGNLYSPIGVLDAVSVAPGGVQMTGWAAEFAGDTSRRLHGPEPTRIMVMVNSEWVPKAFLADKPRPDVDAMFVANPIHDQWGTYLPYRRPGALYGFDIKVPTDTGAVTVCVVAVDTMYPISGPENFDIGGDHALLGCRTVTVA